MSNPLKYTDPTGLAAFREFSGVDYSSYFEMRASGGSPSHGHFNFNPNPTYHTTEWNNNYYREYTNCYSYAFDMLVNPLTGSRFSRGGMGVGMLSGMVERPFATTVEYENFLQRYLSGTPVANANLIGLIAADMATVGLDFIPYSSDLTGGYAIIVVVNPLRDYHFYRQDTDGTWSHKQSTNRISQSVGWNYNTSSFNSETLSDIRSDAESIGYTVYVGEFYLRPSRR
jgi:hypothetical protein